MSGERGEMTGGALLVYAVIAVALLVFLFWNVAKNEAECEARGGTPIVDKTYEVRCVDVPR